MFKMLSNIWSRIIYRRFRIDPQFIVYQNEEKVALLKNPVYSDMFWNYYELLPLTNNQNKLTILYSETFWQGDQIKIQGSESKQYFDFLLAGLNEGWQDENGTQVKISDRPSKLLLRGPYMNDIQ